MNMNESQPQTPDVTITLHERWIPAFVLIVFIIQQVVAGKVLMALAIIVGGFWLLSYFWARSLGASLRIERERRYGWNQVGDMFEERILLTNGSIFPALWLLIEDHSTLVGHTLSLGTGISALNSRRWNRRTRCNQRGEFQLGPIALVTGDPFGIYTVRIDYPQVSDFLVSPPVIPLPQQIEISTGYLMDDRRSMHRQAQSSNVSVSTRLFAPGDSLMRIHWLTTAREDQPYVRQFENIHASNHCWIVLDLDKTVHSLDGEPNSLEQAIILAVSLANRLLMGGVAVGLLAQGDRFAMLPPNKGYDQLHRIQKLMATIQEGDQPLRQVLMQTWAKWNDAANVAFVTPSRDPDWLDAVALLRKAHINASVFLLKTKTDPPGAAERFGQMVSRSGIECHLVPPSLFETPESAPGRLGVIDWKFTPLGRAIKIVEEGKP